MGVGVGEDKDEDDCVREISERDERETYQSVTSSDDNVVMVWGLGALSQRWYGNRRRRARR
jgi:hypothetical protein